ncbi:MAG: Holliday junction resolvase RuvX [Candidatus Magasanikbacteria bacterium]|nr:Holliday junction resolvase RuvX [Candidatus Magasanikbacteria bacterium]
MNLLAIDYGSKNIGLAWVNTAVGVVLPFGQIKNQKFKIQSLLELVERERIDMIVLGLPLGLDGQENKNTKIVRSFAAELKRVVTVPVEFIDERFTSAQADRMESDGVSRDEKAAMVILQTYADSLKHKNIKT